MQQHTLGEAAVKQHVLVTGAAGGLGEGVVTYLLGRGHRVAAADVDPDALKALTNRLAGRLGSEATVRLTVHTVDLTSRRSAQALITAVDDAAGPIDAVLNLVGGYVGGQAVAELDPDDWHGMLTLNATTAFYLMQAALPYLVARGGGALVNISTRRALQGSAGYGAYAASKAALLRLTEAAAEEVLQQGVRVNAVLGSTIDTEANRAARPDADFDRWVKPAAVARVLEFLISPAAEPISGAAVPVYGRA